MKTAITDEREKRVESAEAIDGLAQDDEIPGPSRAASPPRLSRARAIAVGETSSATT